MAVDEPFSPDDESPVAPGGEVETQWGFEITSEGVTSVCRALSEERARAELPFFKRLNPRVMKRIVTTGPWTAAGS